MSKWFGRIIYTREGIVTEREFSSKELSDAYALGARDMKEQYDCADGEEGCLEDFIGCSSDVESKND